MASKNVNKSINVVVSINDKPIAGQTDAVLSQTKETIDITNKINGEWATSLCGRRMWKVNCSGLYVTSAESLEALQSSFLSNSPILLSIVVDGHSYHGEAILTDFPLTTQFSKGLLYKASFLGTGPLE